jgi:hypothetical protein
MLDLDNVSSLFFPFSSFILRSYLYCLYNEFSGLYIPQRSLSAFSKNLA